MGFSFVSALSYLVEEFIRTWSTRRVVIQAQVLLFKPLVERIHVVVGPIAAVILPPVADKPLEETLAPLAVPLPLSLVLHEWRGTGVPVVSGGRASIVPLGGRGLVGTGYDARRLK